jgi:metallo-beta-lactamase family protein
MLPDIPVYLDSPLAIKATEIFRKNKKCYDDEARAILENGYDPFDMPNLKFTRSTQESIAINERSGPAIVIAANGMCTAGRIKHHLKHNLWRKGSSLVIVGFQAKGTTGRKIVDGAKHVKIFRENVSVRARVFTIGGFSAHADQSELLEWVSHFESNPEVFVIHGEPEASNSLAQEIRNRFSLTVHVPEWKEQLILGPSKATRETPSERPPDSKAMILNTIQDLKTELETLSRRIESDTDKQEDKLGEYELDRLKYIQEELQAIINQ